MMVSRVCVLRWRDGSAQGKLLRKSSRGRRFALIDKMESWRPSSPVASPCRCRRYIIFAAHGRPGRLIMMIVDDLAGFKCHHNASPESQP